MPPPQPQPPMPNKQTRSRRNSNSSTSSDAPKPRPRKQSTTPRPATPKRMVEKSSTIVYGPKKNLAPLFKFVLNEARFYNELKSRLSDLCIITETVGVVDQVKIAPKDTEVSKFRGNLFKIFNNKYGLRYIRNREPVKESGPLLLLIFALKNTFFFVANLLNIHG